VLIARAVYEGVQKLARQKGCDSAALYFRSLGRTPHQAFYSLAAGLDANARSPPAIWWPKFGEILLEPRYSSFLEAPGLERRL
jgi:hypothetical protein